MRFGECIECNQYKYIEQDGKCPSCVDKSDWFVYRISGLATPKLVEENLTKEEAKNKASFGRSLIATDKKLGYESEN